MHPPREDAEEERVLEALVAPPGQAEQRLAPRVPTDIEINGKTGTFLGVDENFGLLLRTGDETTLIPLKKLLKD